jgi:hypothetical protein
MARLQDFVASGRCVTSSVKPAHHILERLPARYAIGRLAHASLTIRQGHVARHEGRGQARLAALLPDRGAHMGLAAMRQVVDQVRLGITEVHLVRSERLQRCGHDPLRPATWLHAAAEEKGRALGGPAKDTSLQAPRARICEAKGWGTPAHVYATHRAATGENEITGSVLIGIECKAPNSRMQCNASSMFCVFPYY